MLLAVPSAPAEERSAAPRVEGYAEITPPECGPVPDSYFSDAVFLGVSDKGVLNLYPGLSARRMDSGDTFSFYAIYHASAPLNETGQCFLETLQKEIGEDPTD